MKTFKIPLMLLMSVILTLPLAVYAETETDIERLVSELAEKPEHHQAVARYYRQKAEEARAEAAQHERMGNAYRHSHQSQKGGMPSRQKMRAHCDRLVKNYQSTAGEYEALAKLHESEVGQK